MVFTGISTKDLCTHLATQCPVPSCGDACAPRPQPPLLCCLPHALAWGGVLGGRERGRTAPSCSSAYPSDPLVFPVGARGVCLPAHPPHCSPWPHPPYCRLRCPTPRALRGHMWTWTHSLSDMHTHMPTRPSPCAHAQLQCSLKGISSVTLPLFLQGHTVPGLLHSPPGVPTPWLIMMGMVVPASGYQLDFLGGKAPLPEAITTADPDFFPALSLFSLDFPSLTLSLLPWGTGDHPGKGLLLFLPVAAPASDHPLVQPYLGDMGLVLRGLFWVCPRAGQAPEVSGQAPGVDSTLGP